MSIDSKTVQDIYITTSNLDLRTNPSVIDLTKAKECFEELPYPNVDLQTIQQWEHMHKTSANGDLRLSPTGDMCAVIYKNKVRVFYDRIIEGCLPHCFGNDMSFLIK